MALNCVCWAKYNAPNKFLVPPETFVRADGAFIPFADDFDMPTVTTSVKGVGEIGDVKIIDLQSPISSLIGKQVMKVGRSSGLTNGTVLAYALEYNDEKGICFLTDFLVVGENQQTFDLEGDSGSLIVLKGVNGEKPRPIGIIWGGTANRGRLKLKIGQPPENWTSGVDLGRLLKLLELDLITNEEGLKGLCCDKIIFCWFLHKLLNPCFLYNIKYLTLLQILVHVICSGSARAKGCISNSYGLYCWRLLAS